MLHFQRATAVGVNSLTQVPYMATNNSPVSEADFTTAYRRKQKPILYTVVGSLEAGSLRVSIHATCTVHCLTVTTPQKWQELVHVVPPCKLITHAE